MKSINDLVSFIESSDTFVEFKTDGRLAYKDIPANLIPLTIKNIQRIEKNQRTFGFAISINPRKGTLDIINQDVYEKA